MSPPSARCETAEEVSRVGEATDNTRANVAAVRAVAEELGAVAHRIRDQIEAFSQKLRAAVAASGV